MMKYWEIKLTCSSPVHIGSGHIYKKSEYICYTKNKKAYVHFLNETKWAEYLLKENLLETFVSELERNPLRLSIYEFLKKNADHQFIHHVIEDMIKKEICSHPVTADMENTDDQRNTLNDIHGCIKDENGHMYIPGSSLKGAFRTAIFVKWLQEHKERYRKEWEKIVQEIENGMYGEKPSYVMRKIGKTGKIGKIMEDMEREIFIIPDKEKKRNMTNSLLRGLSVSDTGPALKPGKIVQKADAGENGGRHTISLWRECMMRGEEVFFTLGIDEKIMANLGVTDAESLIKCTQNFVDHQCDLLWDSLSGHDEIESMQDADLILGGGAGFLSKTVMYALAPTPQEGVRAVQKIMKKQFPRGRHGKGEQISPHTLKLAKMGRDYQVMGMCQLSVVKEL